MSTKYTPPHKRTLGARSRRTFTSSEIAERLHIVARNTLASTGDDTLAAIFVFTGEHPLYSATPPQILCKTSLHLLQPAQETAEAQYPLFHSHEMGSRAAFEFAGWVRIVDVQYHAPHSAGLREILDAKWKDKRGRTEEAWKDSLGRMWAAVTLGKVEQRTDNPMHD